MPSPCKIVEAKCRKLRTGHKAKSPCQKRVGLADDKIPGTMVRPHARPKGCADSMLKKFFHLAQESAKKKKSTKKKKKSKSPPPARPMSKRSKKSTRKDDFAY